MGLRAFALGGASARWNHRPFESLEDLHKRDDRRSSGRVHAPSNWRCCAPTRTSARARG